MYPATALKCVGDPCALDTPLDVNMASTCCPSRRASLWVASGRPVSAKFRKPCPGAAMVLGQQEEWSRGCRRAHKSFWLWQWPLSWLLAHRKHRSLHRKSPSSRPRPASTSDLTARAWRPTPAGPAPYLGLPLGGPRPLSQSSSAGSWRLSGAISAHLACGPARSPVRC